MIIKVGETKTGCFKLLKKVKDDGFCAPWTSDGIYFERVYKVISN